MSFLEFLPPHQKEILVSLPYRVGYWVSQADTSGGDQSAEQELQVLSNIIHGFTEDVFGSEIVQLAMRETIARKAEWPQWVAGNVSPLEDCRIALDILVDKADAKDAAAYGLRLMEIAEAVAMAFREYDRMGFGGKIGIYCAYLASRFKKPPGGKPRKSLYEFAAISNAERQALNSLAQALGTSYA